MLIASGLLALLIGAAFVADVLERLVVDVETAQRGYVITHQDRFLEPWRRAQNAFPEQAANLERLVGNDPDQQERARRITQATSGLPTCRSATTVSVAPSRGEAPGSSASPTGSRRWVGRSRSTARPGREPGSRSTCRSRNVLPASRHGKMPARQEP
jgi:hypothetical protein